MPELVVVVAERDLTELASVAEPLPACSWVERAGLRDTKEPF
jgi:Ni,Fe-hydrogenase III component G